jgi:hypothetical protein
MDSETIENKLEIARQKKASADAAFKAGNLTDGKCNDQSRRTLLLALPFIDYAAAQLLDRIMRCAFYSTR